MVLFTGAIFAILLLIAWQDFRFRAVYWWLFVLLLASLAIKQILAIGIGPVIGHMIYNCIFLLVQLLCLTAYFSFKERRPVNIFNGYFGLGDLFFLVGITVYFSFLNFVFYYALSLVMVILTAIVTSLETQDQKHRIPLAGYQAIVLLLFMISGNFIGINWSSDQWLSTFINA